MKDLSLEYLDSLKADYENDKVAKAVRRALYKTDVLDLAKKQEAENDILHQFSIDVKTMKATSQGHSGRCWIFAGCNFLREEVSKKCKIDNFEISQNYVAYCDKLEKINYTMESIINLKDVAWNDRTLMWVLQGGINDGGQWDMFTAIINKYGAMPKSAFPETKMSGSTRNWAMLVNRRLRKFAADVHQNSNDMDKIYSLKDECMKQLYSFTSSCFGVPPQTFDFEYVDTNNQYHIDKNLDPHTFYDKYIGLDLNEYVSLINSPTSDKPYYERFTVNYVGNVTGNKVTYLNITMEDMKKAIIDTLKDGHIVWFGSDVSKWGDKVSGTWNPDSFDLEALFGHDFAIDKENALYYCESAMNHAMCITGVNLDEDKPTKWKIENSWGEESGVKGYYLASDSWFDQQVFQAVINKKYLPEHILACLDKKPIELDPWDPMGTLAD